MKLHESNVNNALYAYYAIYAFNAVYAYYATWANFPLVSIQHGNVCTLVLFAASVVQTRPRKQTKTALGLCKTKRGSSSAEILPRALQEVV